mmetsp:Transcript_15651/g.41443  ORF Transcript_15651/g.41443 Transcript_15651/m.41443 type:complete len:705 (+) Transcript_15651:71-2185(+)
MKMFRTLAVLGACATSAIAETSNPLGKVLDLMDELAAKVTKEGEVEVKAFKEYFDWCDDTAKNGQFAIQTATKQVEKLTAKIAQLTGDIQAGDENIAELASAIATAEKELADATLIREKEASDFAASEHELVDAVDTLDRAVGILQKEASKNPAALAQVDTSNMANMLQALSAVLDASAFPGEDQKKLAAFVQEQQRASEEDAELGAPAAATYKSHSGGIVEVLEDMKEKAESQLSDLRKAENNGKHNFDMLKQSLEDQLGADNKDMDEEKSTKAANAEAKATDEGDLEVTQKSLANSQEELETARSTCMQTASDHEATVNARTEELAVIAKARQVLEETSSGAVAQSYSFVQVGVRMQNRADLAKSEVVTMVKSLAKKHHSAALAQLASKIAAVVKYGALGGEDPFGKVKGLISDMISKLEKEMNEEASEKKFCDEQMSKTDTKKQELDYDLNKMTAKIDQAASASAGLKAEVQELQAELASGLKSQAEMDVIRREESSAFVQAKSDLEIGLEGVRKALGVLREYYGGAAAAAASAAMLQDDQPPVPEKHEKAGGAGTSILGILEVVESDFATNLAKEESEESDAQAVYEKMTEENKLTKTSKDQDVKYKTAEAQSLDKTISDLSSDRETTNTEHAAVMEFYAKIKERCIAKPETYEERKRRRVEEIAGLKEALNILEQETAFVQRPGRKGRSFRGSVLAAAF